MQKLKLFQFSNKNFKAIFNIFLLISIILLIIFSRSFIGIYLFGFRIGELIVGLSLISSIILLLFFPKKIKNAINKKHLYYVLILQSMFFTNFIIKDYELTNLYIFQSSSFIWIISYLILFLLLIENDYLVISNRFSWILNALLIVVYFLQSVYFYRLSLIYGGYSSRYNEIEAFDSGSMLLNFFINYSDKFETYKGTDFLIFFVLVTLINNSKKDFVNKRFSYLIITSSLFLPFLMIRSRVSAAAFVVYVISEIYINYRKDLNVKNYFINFTIGCLIFYSSTIFLFQTGISSINIEMDEISLTQALFNERNIYQNDGSFLEINNGRIYSSDGNLNWRLQIWQDVIDDLWDSDKIFFGYGFENKIPAMEDGLRQGLDGNNEHVHNFIINLLARVGLLGVSVFILIFVNILKSFNSKSNLFFIIPLLAASTFDSSMENVHFPLILYFMIAYKVRNYTN